GAVRVKAVYLALGINLAGEKEILGLCIRSFQTVVTCDFPDNKGIAVADVLEFVEKRTKRGELFYLVLTKFSCYQFGGPIKLMANQVEPGSDVVIYTDEPPARRYYGG
ncbi:hypothetical protein, partial [Halopseudomonas sp.]|uniref:hypothetical protein n=1 Tax=Halopseudomonas sp. TaxID=2901191 RepID=UPI00300328C8